MQANIIAGKLDEAESISASVKRAGIPEQPEYHGQLLQLQVRLGKVKKSDEIEQFMLEHKADQNHAAVRSSKIFSLAMLGDKQGRLAKQTSSVAHYGHVWLMLYFEYRTRPRLQVFLISLRILQPVLTFMPSAGTPLWRVQGRTETSCGWKG